MISAIWFELSDWGATPPYVTRKVVQNTRPSFPHVWGGSGHLSANASSNPIPNTIDLLSFLPPPQETCPRNNRTRLTIDLGKEGPFWLPWACSAGECKTFGCWCHQPSTYTECMRVKNWQSSNCMEKVPALIMMWSCSHIFLERLHGWLLTVYSLIFWDMDFCCQPLLWNAYVPDSPQHDCISLIQYKC